jgi:isopenicillin N synthase-like dioxygenase
MKRKEMLFIIGALLICSIFLLTGYIVHNKKESGTKPNISLNKNNKFDYKFKEIGQEGYFPFRTENAKDYSVKDLKEFYHFYTNSVVPKGMSQNTRNYFDQINRVGLELLKWIQDESPAEVKARFSIPLTQMVEGSGETLLRPIHYPPLEGNEEEGAVRAGAHEDINLITLLPAASAPGLEARDLQGKWHSIQVSPGELAINAGDMLQEASGGYFVSTTHRVVNPTGPEAKLPRYSMPLFIHPRPEVRLSERYTARSYLDERLKQIGLRK